MPISIDSALPQLPASPAAPADTRRLARAPAAATRDTHRLAQTTIFLSAESLQRLKDDQAQNKGHGGAAAANDLRSEGIDLSRLMQRRSWMSSAGAAVDLSKAAAPVQNLDPHRSDFSELLSSPALSDADRTALSHALDLASPSVSQVSNDPGVDLAMRKMKLDYLRDNLVPDAGRPQADAAISTYLSHRASDLDQLSLMLTQTSLDIARSTGHTAQAQSFEQALSAYATGTAPSQQQVKQIMSLADGRQYGSPQQAASSAAQSFAAIKNALLASVSRWPRDQAIGVQQVNEQISRIQNDWADFVARVG